MGPRYKSRLLEFEELFEDTGKGVAGHRDIKRERRKCTEEEKAELRRKFAARKTAEHTARLQSATGTLHSFLNAVRPGLCRVSCTCRAWRHSS
ncbi:MAG: hypothetical protein SGPRY_003915 [Prymnesium sp.]